MKRLLLLGIPALLVACADGTTPTQPASQPASYSGQPSFAVASDLSAMNWRVYNINTAAPKLWDINKAQSLEGGGVEFTFNQVITGWWTVYLFTNYNRDLTNKIISADVEVADVTNTPVFFNRSNTPNDAYVRLVFKSAEGNWDPNDYWWSTEDNSLILSTTTAGKLSISTADCSKWSNVGGKNACDDTAPWTYDNGVTTQTLSVSPHDGFLDALKNVKEIGLSFGRSASYASGVAVTGGTAAFQLHSFTVDPIVTP